MFDRESVAPDRGFGGWGYPEATGATGFRNSVGQLIEPTAVPNIPALTPRQGLFNSSGSLAIFAAIRRASSLVSSLAADRSNSVQVSLALLQDHREVLSTSFPSEAPFDARQ
jgi:hypothetical protein